MVPEKQPVKPYRIAIEWKESNDFVFSCDYQPAVGNSSGTESKITHTHWFPHIQKAMGNVLKKLRREHITFPLFLISLALEHRHLLNEIDELLRALHANLNRQQGEGRYECFIRGESDKEVSG
ncbi:MAG: hypothetical protein OQK67_00865 [Chlorobium sp.]|nr:hypothetical protein [Chlorobium sp.]MCW8814389.1 hypothetical protein [Chlorobium sp.]MCW8819108.1 hypothetical protein [Ignavibacteriaceae bacterium]